MFGFHYFETMRGTYHLFATPIDELPMEFTIQVEGKGMRRFSRERMARIHGQVSMFGMAERSPLEGLVGFKLLDERRMTYDFSFEADDRRRYRFRGQKEYSVFRLTDSVSLLPASIYDANDVEIGRAVLRFDLRGDTKGLLKSFRLKFA
ncbi:MAG: hypothetical protein ABIP39_03765 [Polyangiaceae bacterium]